LRKRWKVNYGRIDWSAAEQFLAYTDGKATLDAVREELATGASERETSLGYLFGGSRLPYRVGCALLDRVEEKRGFEAVSEAFYLDPAEFYERYDPLLDAYRDGV
jgi:predicted GH43/DUF377 family glycosyl hydrolase